MREPYGIPLAIDERTGASLWPREDYPSADEALEAWNDYDENGLWAEFGADLESHELRRVRLVWAWEPEPGWFTWHDHGREASLPYVECWEISPK